MRSKMLLVVLVAAFVALSASPAQAKLRPCPDNPEMYMNNIRVQKVSCEQAERVAVRYTRAIIENLQHDWSLTILGFRCDLTRKDYYGDSHRCTASGGRVILFRRGT
ncbi:MAG TPA: hypothetical protein VGV34_02170 [Solirubrobacterales bacterium]|nr:hypothetical protein [Solirubrobacterales bacterium]